MDIAAISAQLFLRKAQFFASAANLRTNDYVIDRRHISATPYEKIQRHMGIASTLSVRCAAMERARMTLTAFIPEFEVSLRRLPPK